MRSILNLALLLGLCAWFPTALVGQFKKKVVPPIKVVKLDRKEPVLYDKDIEPILVKKCLVCHGGQVKEGRLDLNTYEALMKGGKRGKSVIPGKSAQSILVKTAGRTMKPIMPPKREKPLSPEELALIKLWIDQGAKAPKTKRIRPIAVVTLPPAIVTPVRAVAVSPDKSKVAVGRGNQVYLYDAKGQHLKTLMQPNLATPDKKPVEAAHLSIVDSLAISPDGKTLASGTYKEVALWDIDSGNMKKKLTGFMDRVITMSFSPDGKLLATGGGPPTEDGEIKVFDINSGKAVVDLKGGHSDTVCGVCFSPDGKKLASCGTDKFVKVFEVPSGKFLKSFEGHTHHVLDVGWKSDGKMLASAGADSVIKLWDFEKGEQIRTIKGHTKQVTRLVFVGKTTQFATCSGDKTVRMWNSQNGGSVRTFQGNTDYLYALAVSPDGQLLAAGGQEGVVRLYDGRNGKVLATLKAPGSEPKEEPKKK